MEKKATNSVARSTFGVDAPDGFDWEVADPESRYTITPFAWSRSSLGGLTVPADEPVADLRQGARIEDRKTGLTYEAVAEGKRLVYLAVIAKDGIEPEAFKRIPLQRVAEQVQLHLAAQEARGKPLVQIGDHGGPTLAQIASEAIGGMTIEAQARLHHTNATKISRLRRAAVDLGLMPRPKVGRKRSE
jgi:hypothetical protein